MTPQSLPPIGPVQHELAAAKTMMFQESQQAAQAVRNQFQVHEHLYIRLGRELRETPPRLVATSARGSSDHAATYAKYLIEALLGVITTSAAPSISSIYQSSHGGPDILFIGISQSGKSPDLLMAAQKAKAAGSTVMALVNEEKSPLTKMADINLTLKCGTEVSVAATKSYIATLAAIAKLVGHWRGDPGLVRDLENLPNQLEQAFQLDWSRALVPLAQADHLYVLGRGLGLGIAQEMALKLKETSALHAEAFSTAEVRHGPMRLIGRGFPVFMISQDDDTLSDVKALAQDFVAREAIVICAGFEVEGALNLPSLSANPVLQPILLIQAFYRLANLVALARGKDPDNPPFLTKVTQTK